MTGERKTERRDQLSKFLVKIDTEGQLEKLLKDEKH